jgi:hypothetical protein
MNHLRPQQAHKQDPYLHDNREDPWDEESFEEYYLSQESEEVSTDSEEDIREGIDEDNPDIYITRSGRKSKAPERLQYDVQSC